MERYWPLPPALAPLRILSTAELRTTIAQKRNAEKYSTREQQNDSV